MYVHTTVFIRLIVIFKVGRDVVLLFFIRPSDSDGREFRKHVCDMISEIENIGCKWRK